MDQYSLTEILLDSLIDETGFEPEGDLLDRIASSAPALRRRLRSADADAFGVAATLPIDVAPVLAELLVSACGDNGRFDRDAADSFIAARADDAESPSVAVTLLPLAHDALGVERECAACQAWLDGESTDESPSDADDPHHQRTLLLDEVASRHSEAVDAWAPQFALRIGRDAGRLFHSSAGFDAMHEVVSGGSAPGLSAATVAEAHEMQHAGFALCDDVASLHGFRIALELLRETETVTASITAAEEAVVMEILALSALPAELAVSLVADLAAKALDAGPAPAPTRRLPKGKRRR